MGPGAWWWLTACAAGAADPVVLTGAVVMGHGVTDIQLRGGKIEAIGQVDPTLERVDLSGKWIVPGVADSHVHLAYWPVSDELAQNGVVLAVDLAAPLRGSENAPSLPELRRAGPMITAPGGYPTRSWGEGGYGLEVATAAEARAAVDELHAAGVSLIKVPLGMSPELTDQALIAAVARAHHHGLPVVAHALTEAAAARAAAAGVDMLAHTPTETLTDATVAAWADKTVISTLTAFGARDTTIDNLRRLAEAGTTVLYGTDLGNTRTAGIDPDEIAALQQAGLDGAAITAALTTGPAAAWAWRGGEIRVGADAHLLVLPADPLRDPSAWARAERVIINGAWTQ